jgi:predicted esterase
MVQPVGRRTLLAALAAGAAAAAAGGCATGQLPMSPTARPAPRGGARLTARPGAPPAAGGAAPPGVRALELGPGREVLVRVPAPADGDAGPPRLVLALHGAGGDARAGLAPLLPLADTHRLLLVAPASRDATWDVISRGGWGSDVARIDEALARVLATHPVDPARVVISGFSDGASYALSLGLANADLFTHVVAFSPGFVVPTPRTGTPRVYLAHGRSDPVLPIDRTTRRIVVQLRAAEVPTELHEFDGPHVVPPDIAEDALRWLDQD